MSITDIHHGLLSGLEPSKLDDLTSKLKKNFVDEHEKVICETDPEEIAKDSPSNVQLTNSQYLKDQSLQNTTINKNNSKCNLLSGIMDPTKFMITFSRFPSVLQKKFSEFCDFFGISLCKEINEKCTHLIIHTNDRCEINQNSYTFKYIFALASKIFIVSHLWVIESLKQGVLLKEDTFEVKTDQLWGESLTPNIARTSKKYLFEDTCVFLLSSFDNFHLSRDQILSVLNAAKAVVKTTLNELETLASV
uniref:Breast cancer type 1 susceptibility protein homolog (Trinotate prediction) n=1 Tax=Henneguya salminicola TaxID=69463 RepID=A0A6G3MGQ1_HENSL